MLSKGGIVYSGLREGSIAYFESLGHVLPPLVNPAEYFIDLLAVDSRSEALEAESYERVKKLKIAWTSRTPTKNDFDEAHTISMGANIYNTARQTSNKVSVWRQTKTLASRNFTIGLRDPMGLSGSIFGTIFMSLLNGWIFYISTKTSPAFVHVKVHFMLRLAFKDTFS
jgi:ABC-2 type transporter